MLNVGLIGAGRIGKVHANSVSSHPDSSLVAISDLIARNAEQLAVQYRCDARSAEHLINASDIDTILIASSTDTHADLIQQALSAGKTVFCEKPIDLDLIRARACRELTGADAKSVMIGFNRRFDPNFASIKAAADAGEIGKTELLSITSFDPAPPPLSYVKVCGGLFRDMMIHDFDMANFIMGEKPATISAIGSSIIDPDIREAGDIDTAVATLHFSDGRIAVIKNSRRAVYGYDQRIELLGSQGLLQAHNVTESAVVKSTQSGITSAKPLYFFLERYRQAFQAEWTAFVEAVSADRPFPVTLDDGVAALEMAEAAVRSMESGQSVRLADI